MRFYIFGKGLYDGKLRRLAGPYKKIASVRYQMKVLRWEGYRELRFSRAPVLRASRVTRPRRMRSVI